MHQFRELLYQSTTNIINKLNEIESNSIEQLQTSSSTIFVKTLQMIQLQKAIIAIGMLSIFESILQNRLDCKNGFKEIKTILKQSNKNDLVDRLELYICAINVLKHGKGPSYDKLLDKSNSLPFRIKNLEEVFCDEGDISEISTLIQVDNDFILNCLQLIEDVLDELEKTNSDLYI